MECLKMLENQEPMLRTEYIKQTNEIVVSVMGKIQLEVLQEILSTRFGISATFEKPEVQYRETVAKTVIEARERGPFLSKEDVIKRTKLNNSHIKQLTKMGVFNGMQEENQLSLF